MEKKLWYAVMTDRDDTDWGTGSYDREEAEKMVVNNTTFYQKDGYIAVIDEGNGSPVSKVCVAEILPEDFSEPMYCAYRINAADSWDYMDDFFECIARHADMEDEWASADGDNVLDVVQAIFKKLDITLS